MTAIVRNIKGVEKSKYDLIILGGGIHGIMMALEASRRNIQSLLIEKSDFGGATSYNSLRIIHGGFRYLQSLDVQRVIESSHERRWFLRHFPQLVSPMACLFPLYGNGLRRPRIFGPAMTAYNWITYQRNLGVKHELNIPDGRLVDAQRALDICPSLSATGLKGGGVWHDAFMPDSQRVVIGCLRWAVSMGLAALNYTRAKSLKTDKGKVVGVIAVDEETGNEHEFRSPMVVNMAGPWCRELAGHFHRDIPSLFKSMLAWNVLFDLPPLSRYATAITNGKSSAHTYFSVPWKGKLFVGTGQAPWKSLQREPKVTEQQLKQFCDDLTIALPNMKFKVDDIVNVYAGLQSAIHSGGTQFTKRTVFVNHADSGGPNGLYSVSGVKFTTARLVSEKALAQMIGRDNMRKIISEKPPDEASRPQQTFAYDWMPADDDHSWKKEITKIIEQESVLHLDDLIIRRTSIGDNPQRAMSLADQIGLLFGWDAEQRTMEIERLSNHYAKIARKSH